MKKSSEQVIIIGSGLAGLMSAYQLAQKKIHSLVLSKGPLIQTNTWMAQGGVAAAVSSSDSIENHLKDTLAAGDGLCIKQNVQKILELGPSLIDELIRDGMAFDSNGLQISLGKEGGHQQRRILHVDDQTGRALHEFILYKLQETELSDFCSFLPDMMVLTAKKSAETFNLELFSVANKTKQSIDCSHLVLATGGAGKAFLYTSNWEGATGDGLKIAHDLGATLKNLEMVQFHPTCLYHSKARNFLISEALRGEGAKLIDEKGYRFTFDFHKDGELAPRDIVSRAIEHQIKSTGKDCVHLDISHHSRDYLEKRFPTIFNRCLELGLDISSVPIPVVPAAHYTCGGIETCDDLVSTSIPNLYAIGECGYTGLHGANRLASNSLLECLATAHLCAKQIHDSKTMIKSQLTISTTTDDIDTQTNNTENLFLVNALWDEVRTLMWNFVGIQRSTNRLQQALSKILSIEDQAHRWINTFQNRDACELINIIFFSKSCILSALARTESRGCHYNIDYPEKSSNLFTTSIKNNEATTSVIEKELSS